MLALAAGWLKGDMIQGTAKIIEEEGKIWPGE